MGLTSTIASLASRTIRTSSTGGKARKVVPLASNVSKNKSGGILGCLWGGLSGFINSLVSGVFKLLVGGIQWSFTALWSLIVATTQFIWNFNWNVSDAELDKTISSAFDNLGSTLGGFVGTAAGYLSCGVLPGAVIFAFNEPLGMHILERVGEEALEELTGSLAQVIRSVFTGVTNATMAYLYKNVRKLWRESDDDMKAKLKKKGIKGDDIQKAINDRNKPWSIAKKIEEKIENIDNKFLRNFAEEFLEQFGESCIEAGYAVAGTLDNYYAQQKTGLGGEQTVEIEFKNDGTTKIHRVTGNT